MADFTITTTITGTVNGQAISNTHTYTVEDVTHVIEESALVGPGKTLTTFQNAVEGRGYHTENAPKFMAFGFQQAVNGTIKFGTTALDVPELVLVGTAPVIIHHGEDFDGNMDSEASTTPPNPTEDVVSLDVQARAPFELRAIALFKPVS